MGNLLVTDIKEFSQAKEFWLNHFSGDIKDTVLRENLIISEMLEMSSVSFDFTSNLNSQLNSLSKNNDLSAFVFIFDV